MICIEPILADLIQMFLGKELTLIGLERDRSCVYKSLSSLIFRIGSGDLLAHHSIGVGLHISRLVLLKGSLEARLSYVSPDKVNQLYGYSCDGPSRGGTCDVSSWDSYYLASFWVLNTLAWITFYYHWKHLSIEASNGYQFIESSLYLNGWFRDYLWLNSGALIRGYNADGMNELSVWSWTFLGAHLVFATRFMFLISWHGY